jgi:hydrogenase maturation protease
MSTCRPLAAVARCAHDPGRMRPGLHSPHMARILIIAYGNPLRCDDGLAWRAADEMEKRFSGAPVEILRTHQLAPELAETVSRFEAVIFVDAASADGTNSSPGEVRSAAVVASEGAPRFSHQLSPGAVLALATQLFGRAPRAFSVTLTGECFDHGESLSLVVEAALPALVARIEALVRCAIESLPTASCKA